VGPHIINVHWDTQLVPAPRLAVDGQPAVVCVIPAIAFGVQPGESEMYSSARKILSIPIFCALLSAFASTAARAQSSASPDVLIAAPSSAPAQRYLTETVVLDVGIFVLGTTTKASLNGQAVQNPEIDFNRTFGAGSDTSRLRIDGLWRITPRQHIEFMYFTNSITRTRTLDQPIDWGDYQFQANGEVTAKNRLSVYELGYEYAFLRRPTFELAGSFGIHFTKASLGLSGQATLLDSSGHSTGSSFEANKTASIPAPLPVLGLRAGWAFAPHFVLDGQVQVFDFSYNAFHGHWTDFNVGLKYLFNSHFGIGIGYDDFSTHLSLSKNSFNGRLNLGYRGGLIQLTGAF
jgi:hypothetical protein